MSLATAAIVAMVAGETVAVAMAERLDLSLVRCSKYYILKVIL
jgi:hypothetical protein